MANLQFIGFIHVVQYCEHCAQFRNSISRKTVCDAHLVKPLERFVSEVLYLQFSSVRRHLTLVKKIPLSFLKPLTLSPVSTKIRQGNLLPPFGSHRGALFQRQQWARRPLQPRHRIVLV